MLFKINKDELVIDESYKERNLYYKIFAGYLFNNLIPGIEKRKADFFDRLIGNVEAGLYFDRSNQKGLIISQLKEISVTNLHMSFDYHLAQLAHLMDDSDEAAITYTGDRGEMSDILLLSENHLISIECKFLSDFTVAKDIVTVQKRMHSYLHDFGPLKLERNQGLQVLLVKEDKWRNSKVKNSIIKDSLLFPLIILFWEHIEEMIVQPDHEEVKDYLKLQLKAKYKLSGGNSK